MKKKVGSTAADFFLFQSYGLGLFLSALLGNHVGCAEAGEQDDAAAEGSVLVFVQAVRGQTRREGTATFLGKEASLLIDGITIVAAVLAVEHATLCKSGETQSEDDCDCHY